MCFGEKKKRSLTQVSLVTAPLKARKIRLAFLFRSNLVATLVSVRYQIKSLEMFIKPFADCRSGSRAGTPHIPQFRLVNP